MTDPVDTRPHNLVINEQQYSVELLGRIEARGFTAGFSSGFGPGEATEIKQINIAVVKEPSVSVVTVAQQGPQGGQGLQGIQGQPGPPGEPGVGSQILFGTAIPDNLTQGIDGDVYFRTNGQVYKKAAGVWDLKMTLAVV